MSVYSEIQEIVQLKKQRKLTAKLLFKETVDGYQRGFRQILKLRLPERYKGHLNTIAE